MKRHISGGVPRVPVPLVPHLAAVALWILSAALLIYGTLIEPAVRPVFLSWALWVQMVAWGFTAWWIYDHIALREVARLAEQTEMLSVRDRVRVAELAEIMARVAIEERVDLSEPAKLHRIH